MKSKRIILAGATGFLGTILARYFQNKNWDVVVLTRSQRANARGVQFVHWDGRTIDDWAKCLDGADVVINLAGRSVNCRYHARNREQMIRSRVDSTRVLGEAIALCAIPPRVWLNSSTATIYKHSLNCPMDESSEIGATPEAKDAFSIEVARAWEETFNAACTRNTRKVTLRTAMVFGAHPGTVFRVLRNLVRCGLGGKMASGNQYVSWIHEADFCRAIEWLIEHDDVSGIVNLAAPNPVPNREMMRLFRAANNQRIGLPATLWMLELGAFFLRTETELIIKSRRVVPTRLLTNGFQFRFEHMQDAIAEIEGRLLMPQAERGSTIRSNGLLRNERQLGSQHPLC